MEEHDEYFTLAGKEACCFPSHPDIPWTLALWDWDHSTEPPAHRTHFSPEGRVKVKHVSTSMIHSSLTNIQSK